MIQNVYRVEFPYIYDLFYRVRNASLEDGVYMIEFKDWVDAGIAYNVYEGKNPARKISYFAELRKLIVAEQYDTAKAKFGLAIVRFYEDLFQMYQDHLLSQLKAAASDGRSTTPQELVIIPSFTETVGLQELFDTLKISLESYIPQHIVELRSHLSSIYAEDDSLLFRGAGLYFDYGIKHQGDGILLEVV